MNSTAIAWTDYTWNLFSGCKKISPECKFCYADQLAEQRRGTAAFPHGFDLTMRPHKLGEPAKLLRSRGPSLIFCESMSDIGLDDDELTPPEIDRLYAAGFASMDHLRDAFFDVTEETSEHRYQILSKRLERLLRYFADRNRRVPPSCWIGATIGHRSTLDRLPWLRQFRAHGARVLFISAEPLLDDLVAAGLTLDGIDWLIAGGESGTHASDPKHGARFLVHRVAGLKYAGRYGWAPRGSAIITARTLRNEAARAGCAFFLKQWGGPRPDSGGRLLDDVEHDGMPVHVDDAMPARRIDLGGAATAALARKRLPLAPEPAR